MQSNTFQTATEMLPFYKAFNTLRQGVSNNQQMLFKAQIKKRFLLLQQMKRLISEHQTTFEQALFKDLGKSSAEAWVSEIGFLLKDIRHTQKHLKRWAKPKPVANPLLIRPARTLIQPEPLGVIFVLGAWNYPLQLSLAPVIAALAAGNSVLLKPSEIAPNTSQALAHLVPQYFNSEQFQVFEGNHRLVQKLLNLPFNHIFYTGGSQAAKSIMTQAAKNLIPVTLELGGKSPVVVSQDCPLTTTARRIVWGKFMNAGQTCIAPDYALVHSKVATDFIKAIQTEITAFYSAQPQLSKDYGRIVSLKHFQRLVGYLDEAQRAGATIIGGRTDAAQLYIEPTLVLQCPLNSALMTQEIFGPILPIVEVQTFQAAIEFIQARPHPLAGYLFSSNKAEQKVFEAQIQAGTLCLNDTLSFMLNPELPFGGVGASGMGAYHGYWGFQQMSHLKPVVKRSFLFEHSLRYPPYNKIKQRLTGWLLK